MRITLSLYSRTFGEITLLLALFMGATSCAHKRSSTKVPKAPSRAVIGATERGLASWYGEPYHGRRAANGEVFDMYQLTAAHRTLPFGTWVRVHNETNGKKVAVRITDRGPFIAKRIIDLSRKAAQDISMIGAGVVPVVLTVIEAPVSAVIELYGVQAGAFQAREHAEKLQREIEEFHIETRLLAPDETSPYYRVICGSTTREDAAVILGKMRAAGKGGLVVRLQPALLPQKQAYPQKGQAQANK